MELLLPITAAPRVVDNVREQLRQAILDGQLAPGARLSVPALARQLGVSRSPVREAVLQLVAEGLAVERSRRGVEVAQVAVGDLVELYQVRAAIEGLAARLAAERVGGPGLAELSGLVSAQRFAVEREDAESYRELDARFHFMLVGVSGNARLAGIAARLAAEIRLAARGLAGDPQHIRQSLAEHEALVEAIRARDPDRAEAVMRAHLLRVGTRLMQHQERKEFSRGLSGLTPRRTI